MNLFDADVYGPGKAQRPPPPKPKFIESDGGWWLHARISRPPSTIAHRLESETLFPDAHGARTTVCGIGARLINVEAGRPVKPCPDCLKAKL
jgi:hypothetical protein